MEIHDKVSTGLQGFDQVIDKLRLGDNVVWQVDEIKDYQEMVIPYVNQARIDGRKIIYVRFGNHQPLLEEKEGIKVLSLEAQRGFESFATAVHDLIEAEGRNAFYVFDCLSDLLEYWHSDLMIANFFRVACPYLYELDTLAYFAIIRNVHTFSTIASIRETTQLLLDLYQINGQYYIHPLKVWQRYSPTMFFPHLIQGQSAVCITASSEAAELFSCINRSGKILDNWDMLINKGKEALSASPEQQEEIKKQLITLLMGTESRMLDLCRRYFTLRDILRIASREVGTGLIGGKSVGMLLSRKILEREGGKQIAAFLEPHDSYYIGSDVFYTYIVQNGWWELRAKQKTAEGYFQYASQLREKLLHGRFPENIREKFMQMLEYFGQSPIIVRSSSLLEDNFGNAFAGKYDSFFCVNQGTPGERYQAFEQTVRLVYASTMNEDALTYRLNRGLLNKDEQMAILVQRVSGDYYQDYFFPHAAGVGNSSNLYVWDKKTDMEAGMLRLVFGLGTRAVDRTASDYARIVCLDDPLRTPLTGKEDRRKFSQHYVDVLSLPENALVSKSADEILAKGVKVEKELFASIDYEAAQLLREQGYEPELTPYILDFRKMLEETELAPLMRKILAILAKAYNYPVDIEYTINFTKDKRFKVNLLQCRPLQTRGLGRSVELPEFSDDPSNFIATKGNFMGGNVRLPIDYVVFVQARAYQEINQQEKYAVARMIGRLNSVLKGKSVLLIGPGRWGTSTPSLGVPVHFSEICHMAAIAEYASPEAGFMPEVSYGSHFFQDLVETGIFYLAVYVGQKDVVFNPQVVLERENILAEILPQGAQYGKTIHLAATPGMELYSDISSQTLICRSAGRRSSGCHFGENCYNITI